MAGLIMGVGKYSIQACRQRSSSPKFQIYNPALTGCRFSGSFREVRQDHEQWGRLVESAVGSHLLNHREDSDYLLFYWSERNLEVDFILKKEMR